MRGVNRHARFAPQANYPAWRAGGVVFCTKLHQIAVVFANRMKGMARLRLRQSTRRRRSGYGGQAAATPKKCGLMQAYAGLCMIKSAGRRILRRDLRDEQDEL